MFRFQTNLHDLLSTYGYGGVALLLALESLGFPVQRCWWQRQFMLEQRRTWTFQL